MSFIGEYLLSTAELAPISYKLEILLDSKAQNKSLQDFETNFHILAPFNSLAADNTTRSELNYGACREDINSLSGMEA